MYPALCVVNVLLVLYMGILERLLCFEVAFRHSILTITYCYYQVDGLKKCFRSVKKDH